MIPSRDTPVSPKRRWHLERGTPQPNSATLYPRIERHSANYPHFKGTLNVDNILFHMSVWKRETEKEGVRYPLLTMQIRHQDYERQKDALRALHGSGYRMGNGLQGPGHGIAFPQIHRDNEKYPHWKGEINVFGVMYWVAVWNHTFWKTNERGKRLEYPAMIMRLREQNGRRRDPNNTRQISEPNKPAYLCDHDSHRRFLLGERDDPKSHAEEYEYQRQLEMQRKKGFYV